MSSPLPFFGFSGGSLEVVFVLAIDLQRSKLIHQKHAKSVNHSVITISISLNDQLRTK